jgi:hypothetical protein
MSIFTRLFAILPTRGFYLGIDMFLMTENLHRNESLRTVKEHLNLKRFGLIATV